MAEDNSFREMFMNQLSKNKTFKKLCFALLRGFHSLRSASKHLETERKRTKWLVKATAQMFCHVVLEVKCK